MQIQQAPQAVTSEIVVAWRDNGGFWSSKAFSRADYYQEVMTEGGKQRYFDSSLLDETWFAVVCNAEAHDEHYYSSQAGDVTRVKAEEILGMRKANA